MRVLGPTIMAGRLSSYITGSGMGRVLSAAPVLCGGLFWAGGQYIHTRLAKVFGTRGGEDGIRSIGLWRDSAESRLMAGCDGHVMGVRWLLSLAWLGYTACYRTTLASYTALKDNLRGMQCIVPPPGNKTDSLCYSFSSRPHCHSKCPCFVHQSPWRSQS